LRNYECIIIIAPDAGEAASGERSKKYAELILSRGGELTKIDNWGKRKLAYEILNHMEGSYVLYQFRGDQKVIAELDRQLHLDEKILRHLIVKNPLATGEEAVLEANQLNSEEITDKEEG